MYTRLCIARVFDDHRSCQKLINYITNIKAKSKRYHWIQKIPVVDDDAQLQVMIIIIDLFNLHALEMFLYTKS
jgi:hypothetical protein